MNQALLVRQVRRASTRLGLRRPIVWAYVPHATYLTEVLQPELVIYHCVDDIAAQKGVHGPSFRALEKKFVREADLVLASSGDLASRLRRWSALVLDAPNVADVPFFSQALGPGPEDYGMQRLRRPRVVFSGAVVATKVNTEWLAAVARLLPNVDFALVGPLGAGDPKTDVSAIEAVPNIHLLGARPYTELPNVLRAADVAMIPYSLNRLTASIFPMKVYEYMAAGLPIVSTPLPSLQGVAGIAFAATPQRAADLITELVATDSADRRRSRSALAQGHSWNDRLDEINDAVAQLLAPGDRVVRRRKLGV